VVDRVAVFDSSGSFVERRRVEGEGWILLGEGIDRVLGGCMGIGARVRTREAVGARMRLV